MEDDISHKLFLAPDARAGDVSDLTGVFTQSLCLSVVSRRLFVGFWWLSVGSWGLFVVDTTTAFVKWLKCKETNTDLLSQFQACKLVWSIVQKKFFLWWTCHGVVQQDGVGDENPQQCVCFPSEWVGVCLRKYGLIGKSRQKIFRDRPSNAFTHWGNLDISYKNLTLARSLFLFAVFLFGGLQHKDSFKWIFIG